MPIGYVMSNGEASKLTLACQLLDEVMPILEKRQVILLFDSWYAKRELISRALSYPNLNVICNAVAIRPSLSGQLRRQAAAACRRNTASD